MDLGIRGQACLIVGGARGIGFATAEALAREGAALALADIDGAAATASAAKLAAKSGAKVVGLQVDVTNLDQVRRMATEAEAANGPLSILINSAAVLDDKLFVELEACRLEAHD